MEVPAWQQLRRAISGEGGASYGKMGRSRKNVGERILRGWCASAHDAAVKGPSEREPRLCESLDTWAGVATLSHMHGQHLHSSARSEGRLVAVAISAP